MRDDAVAGNQPMLSLPADAPLHHSMVGCGWCENFCYDHYLEWSLRHASLICPAMSRARANFSGGMTERAGLLTAVSREGHHARQRAGVELNERRVRSWEFVDDTARRGAARSLHSLARLLTLASVLLCACSVRIGPAQWWRGASRKAKHENSSGHCSAGRGHCSGGRPFRGATQVTLQSWLDRNWSSLVWPHPNRRCLPRPRGIVHTSAFLSLLVLLLLLSRALLWLFHTRIPAPVCLPLPPNQEVYRPHLANGTLSPSSSSSSEQPPFVLLWSTSASSFTLRSRRCIESIFFHHPRAAVRVYSNELPQDFFHQFTELSFDITLHTYDLTKLLTGTPAEPWLSRLSEWRRGPYFYSHVTDAVRLALLFRVGGVYLDSDVIVTRPFRLAAEGGVQLGRRQPTGREMHPLRNALGIESYEGLGGLHGPTLNGAVMAFDRGATPGDRTLSLRHRSTPTRSHTHTRSHPHALTPTRSHTHTLSHLHLLTPTRSHTRTLSHTASTHTCTCSHLHLLTIASTHTHTLSHLNLLTPAPTHTCTYSPLHRILPGEILAPTPHLRGWLRPPWAIDA